MYPQAELENYKLQVELLQEKLQRSEGSRQQLEHKLDKILQKRCEFEKANRHKTRQKYQEFLEEQAKRNERNKKLVHMLERIDEQTAVMSQRSERLKMMKLQYQMYFAKLVQSQTLRCIQQTSSTAATAMPQPIPVLVAPQTAATAATAAAATTAPTTAASANTLLLGNRIMPDAAAAPQWTFAMATPTQAGMLLTRQRPASAADLMQYAAASAALQPPQLQAQPLYMPLPELFSSAQAHSAASSDNLYDLRATLRALDNENVDLPQRLLQGRHAADFANDVLLPGEHQQASSNDGTATTTSSTSTGKDKSLHELSSTSSTLATSSLAFDKLPKTMTTAAMSATSPALTLTELPQNTLCDDNRRKHSSSSSDSGSNNNGQPKRNDVAWAPNSCVTKAEHEKLPSVAAAAASADANNEQNYLQQAQLLPQEQTSKFEAYFGELKIDEPPWQPAAAQPTTLNLTSTQAWTEDKLNMQTAAGVTRGFNSDLFDEVKASRDALEKAAAAVDEQLARGGNQLAPTICSSPAASDVVVAKPSLSIENIENAIYGERLTTAAAAAAAAMATEAADNALPSVFEKLAAGQQQQQHQQQEQPSHSMEAMIEPTTYDVGQIEYRQYEKPAYAGHETAISEASFEPTYASIETNAEAQQQHKQQLQQEQQQASGEPIYSEIGNPTDYQQYAADANATGQDYSNIDYGNYDASEYAGGYDPNAYPGYIYDEASGQYIADPNAAQFATDDNYAAQEYEANATGYDYNAAYGEQQQQQQQQPVESYALPEAEPATAAAAIVAENLSAELADVKNDATPAAALATAVKHVKPTSILTSTDKQAAPNDAKQQSQPQQQQSQQQKKKKRVNFVDSSETDESSSMKPTPQGGNGNANGGGTLTATANATTTNAGNESDFDFSTGSEAKN